MPCSWFDFRIFIRVSSCSRIKPFDFRGSTVYIFLTVTLLHLTEAKLNIWHNKLHQNKLLQNMNLLLYYFTLSSQPSHHVPLYLPPLSPYKPSILHTARMCTETKEPIVSRTMIYEIRRQKSQLLQHESDNEKCNWTSCYCNSTSIIVTPVQMLTVQTP
jgi:hypothetical protein